MNMVFPSKWNISKHNSYNGIKKHLRDSVLRYFLICFRVQKMLLYLLSFFSGAGYGQTK